MLTLLDYLDLADEMTEIDDLGRVVVPFLDQDVLHAHARQVNRQRAQREETRAIEKRAVAHV